MLNETEIEELREIFTNSNNPFYLFDDDGDGTCAYLILKKHYNKGTGIPVKSSGEYGIDYSYIKQIEEEKADLAVILDKPIIKQSFIDKMNCPTVILDHHPLLNLKKVKYYNPLKHGKNVPTTYLAYQITQSNLWIAIAGCLFDHYTPEFIEEFKKEYPDLLESESKDPGYLAYETKMSKIIKIISFNIKGKTKEVKESLVALEKVQSPYEILNKTTKYGKFLYKRYEKLNKEYEELLESARKLEDRKENIVVFLYPSEKISFTRELSNELSYLNQDKTVIVGREKDGLIKMSLRNPNKNLLEAFEKAKIGLECFGGGHEHACGCSLNKNDLTEFTERIKKLTK